MWVEKFFLSGKKFGHTGLFVGVATDRFRSFGNLESKKIEN